MSYVDAFNLAMNDNEFRGRISACIAEQAKTFKDDTRPEFYKLALDALDHNAAVTADMAILVTTQPGIDANSTDGDILAAVQYVWPIAGHKYTSTP